MTTALTTMLEQGPATLHRELGDWTIEQFEGRTSFSSKEKITFLTTTIYDEISPECSMITRQQDIQVNLKHTMHYANIIGGQDYEHMSRITYKDADYANNSRSTDHHHNLCISLWKELSRHDPSPIVPWILSQTYHR